MFITVKVKKQPLPGSVLIPVSSSVLSRALPGHGMNVAFYSLQQNRGEVRCPTVQLPAQHGPTCHHTLFLLLQPWMLGGLGCHFLTYDSSDSRQPTKMPVCLSVCFCDVCHHSAQEHLELLPYFERESGSREVLGSGASPGEAWPMGWGEVKARRGSVSSGTSDRSGAPESQVQGVSRPTPATAEALSCSWATAADCVCGQHPGRRHQGWRQQPHACSTVQHSWLWGEGLDQRRWVSTP